MASKWISIGDDKYQCGDCQFDDNSSSIIANNYNCGVCISLHEKLINIIDVPVDTPLPPIPCDDASTEKIYVDVSHLAAENYDDSDDDDDTIRDQINNQNNNEIKDEIKNENKDETLSPIIYDTLDEDVDLRFNAYLRNYTPLLIYLPCKAVINTKYMFKCQRCNELCDKEELRRLYRRFEKYYICCKYLI